MSAPAGIGRLRGANNEGVLAIVIVVIVIGMTIANPSFLSIDTLFSIARSSIVPTVMALGVLMIIISGGIDVSFAAIGIFAAYTTVKMANAAGFDPSIVVLLLVAVVIGAALGAVNGVVIARFRLPTLIVTLGTQGIFRGVLLAYIGSQYIADLPGSMAGLSRAAAVRLDFTSSYLHVLVIPVIVLCLLVAWLLSRTMFGRGIYAMGGDQEAARRAGFPVKRQQMMLYILVGSIVAIGGVLHVILNRSANPQDLVGGELDIIAAVVLGGASIFGGRGSVLGTVLGVVLVQLINNSLLLIGVPGAWQRAAVGFMLIAGVSIQAIAAKRSSRRTLVNDLVEAA